MYDVTDAAALFEVTSHPAGVSGVAGILVDLALAGVAVVTDHAVYGGDHPQSFASAWPVVAVVATGAFARLGVAVGAGGGGGQAGGVGGDTGGGHLLAQGGQGFGRRLDPLGRVVGGLGLGDLGVQTGDGLVQRLGAGLAAGLIAAQGLDTITGGGHGLAILPR